MDYVPFKIVRSPEDVSLEIVKRNIDEQWAKLRADPDQAAILPVQVPFHVGRGEAQFGVAETILISIASGVGKTAVEGAWKIIWPKLCRKLNLSETLEPYA